MWYPEISARHRQSISVLSLRIVCRALPILLVVLLGLQTCTFVLIMESYAREHRTIVGCLFEIFWGVGVLWLACVSWIFKNWRHIQLAISAPSCVAIIYIWLMPESVRWLVAKQRYKEAERILRRAAKFNGVDLPEDPLDVKVRSVNHITEPEKETRNYTLIDMFRTKQLCKRSIILSYVWFVTATGYYGLSLSITSLAGNKYLNLFLGGLLELPAYCSAVYILTRFGRRRPLCVYLFIGGVFCITAGTIPDKIVGGVDLRHVSTALAVIGRFGMAGCFSVVLLYTCELFPTVIRNISIGFCSFWARVGGMVAPQIVFLSQFTFPAFPVVVIGCISLLGGLLALALPETLNRSLTDTIEQAEAMGQKQKTEPQTNNLNTLSANSGGTADEVEEYLLQGPKKKETFI